MNQIIFISNKTPENYKFKKNKKLISKYKLLFYFCIFIIILCIIFFVINSYNSYKEEKLSKALMNNFTITKLYSNLDNINSNLSINNIVNEEPFVIGLIEIKKIDIMYPILSETNEDFLKIAPCKFYGSMPNEVRKSLHCWTQLCK